jgi:recombination protein RecA
MDLKQLISELNSIHKDVRVLPLSDESIEQTEAITTGSLKVDLATGVGGFPTRRITTLNGTESSGKTTLCLQAAAEVTQKGGLVGFIDYEHALDKEYCQDLGINLDYFILSQPDYAEQGIDIIKGMVKSDKFDLIILDSIAAMLPKEELETGEARMGLHAKMMSAFYRNVRPLIHKSSKTAFVQTNQFRSKIGIVYGSPETVPGGHAEKFYADIRIDLRKTSKTAEESGEIVSNEVNIKVVKNKLAAPFRTATISIVYGKGTDPNAELVDIASHQGVIKKSGSWYSYGEIKLGQGGSAAAAMLADNQELFNEIKSKCRL